MTPAQCLRGTSRVSVANEARSAGSYRIRPACRRSTAFSCRSTSNSASFVTRAPSRRCCGRCGGRVPPTLLKAPVARDPAGRVNLDDPGAVASLLGHCKRSVRAAQVDPQG
jgi:hypothetical protein